MSEASIRAWWTRWPDANIGVPTGTPSKLMVVDIDPRNGGNESFEALIAKHGPLPRTAEQFTGGGGRHIVFRHPGVKLARELAPGIDLKAEGGYIIAAPSIHESGKRYVWDGMQGEAALLSPANVPDWLLERATVGSGVLRSRTVREKAHASAGGAWNAGERNTKLASVAGALRKSGVSVRGMKAALHEENRLRCSPPLDTSEVDGIAESISRYPEGDPGIFVPPGYDSAFSAVLEVLRFTSDMPEGRVLQFHIERSLGYGKASDRTSLSQLVDGVRSPKLHMWIRRGCGLQKAAITKANRSLVQCGLLEARKRSSPENGNESTEYAVNWARLNTFIAARKALIEGGPCLSSGQALVSESNTHNHTQPLPVEWGRGALGK